MPMAAMGSANAATDGLQAITLSSSRMSIIEAVSNALAATFVAATATELITPMTYAAANCRWIKVGPNGGKAFFRCKYDITVDMTTPPTIYVIGAFAGDTVPANQFATDGTVNFARLDALSGVAGIQLVRTAATDQRSSANRYTPWYSFTSPYTGVVGDLLGASHVLVLCSVGSVVASGSAATPIEMGLIN